MRLVCQRVRSRAVTRTSIRYIVEEPGCCGFWHPVSSGFYRRYAFDKRARYYNNLKTNRMIIQRQRSSSPSISTSLFLSRDPRQHCSNSIHLLDDQLESERS